MPRSAWRRRCGIVLMATICLNTIAPADPRCPASGSSPPPLPSSGGAAPVVDSTGNIWVSTGNGSVHSYSHAYARASITKPTPTPSPVPPAGIVVAGLVVIGGMGWLAWRRADHSNSS